MFAYLIIDCQVTDAAKYEDYKRLAPPAIEKYGGRYLVRGGAATLLEGQRQPNRVVVLEFPDVETARRFYDSPEYRAARDMRAGAAIMNIIVVEGLNV